MAIKFEVVEQSFMGSTGNVDITISGFGTPVAAMFFYNVDTADDTIGTTVRKSVGYTDGTNQVTFGGSSQGNLTTTETSRTSSDSSVIRVISGDNASLFAEAEFVQWITDGVRVNVTTADFGNRLVKVVLIGGSSVLNAYVDSAQLTSTSNVVSGVGFEPTLVFIGGTGNSNLNPTIGSDNFILSEGVAVNDGSDSNYCIMGYDENGQTTTDSGKYISNTYSVGQLFNGSLNWGGSLGTYTSSGFTVSTSASPGNDYIFYLALELDSNVEVSAGIEDTPTSTGSHSFGSTSFTPTAMYSLLSAATAVDTVQSELSTGVFAAYSSSQYGMSIYSQDSQSLSNVDRISKSGGWSLLNSSGKLIDTDFTGFTSSGADFDFTTTSGTARKVFNLFIGENTGASGTSLLKNRLLSNVLLGKGLL